MYAGELTRNDFFAILNKTFLAHFIKMIFVLINLRIVIRRKTYFMRSRPLGYLEKKIVDNLKNYGYSEIQYNFLLKKKKTLFKYTFKNLERKEKNDTYLKKAEIWDYYFFKNLQYKNPLIQFALSDELLTIAANYLNTWPLLRYVLVTQSKHVAKGINYSQKWHFDYDDIKMLKFFIYLSDVNSDDDGPFMLLNKKLSSKYKINIIPRHLYDEELNPDISYTNVMQGKKLSMFVVDTSRVLHCGSRVKKNHQRLLYTALFTSYPSNYGGNQITNNFIFSRDYPTNQNHLKALYPD